MLASALSPSCMALIGQGVDSPRREVVFLIHVSQGVVSLLPCESHDIDGGPDPATWVYRCSVGGPETTADVLSGSQPRGLFTLTYATRP